MQLTAALSAARWVKEQYPRLFARVAGSDAHRVVNHPSRAVGDGWRSGSDAIVLEGSVFDVYRGIGTENEPQAMNAGPSAPGRLRA